MTKREGDEVPRRPTPEAHDEPQPDTGPRGEPSARPPGPEGSPEAARQEAQDLRERLQRLAADFSNYQKRVDRRIEEARREAVRRLVLDLLPAIDNFERAMAHAETTPDFQSLSEGIRLVHEQLLVGLKKHGITPIEAAAQRFDPMHHEAIAHLPSEEHPAGQVIGETQRGYRFGDETLRAARVAVSSGKPEGVESEEEEGPDGAADAGPGARQGEPHDGDESNADV